MPRAYRMQARAESAEATRRRVIDAARQAILDGPAPEISMGDVARRAGVARSTLYASHGSQAGLIGAVMVDAGMRGGFEHMLELFNMPDAAEAMRLALREGMRMIASDYELARRGRILAQLDPAVMAGMKVSDEFRAGGMRYQAGRLAEQGHLRPGVTVEDAAALLYALTDLGTFEALRSGFGLDTEQIADFTVAVASRQLLRDG